MKLLSLSHRQSCLCPYCINIKYKLLALRRACVGVQDGEEMILSEDEFLDMLLCKREGTGRFHKYSCIFGSCAECKDTTATIKNHYSLLLQISPSPLVTWNRWERTKMEDGKVKRVMVTKCKSVCDLIDELCDDVKSPCQGSTYMEHVFIASWQSAQFQELKETLPSGWVLLIADFAKNRSVNYQDEIKSAFFGKRQITMHPTIVYYRDPDTGSINRESHVFMSDDTSHDFHAVHHFLQESIKTLEETLDISKVVIYSDGCGAQYKSRGPLADISLLDIVTDHSYFGSEHGKSESDGETGVINHAVDLAIVGRQVVVNNASDLVNWCKENLSRSRDGFTRSFFLVTDINRDRPETDVATVKGVRKFHQVKNTGIKYQIMTRNLSCYCQQCKRDIWPCQNEAYVSKFVTRTIIPSQSSRERHRTGKCQP